LKDYIQVLGGVIDSDYRGEVKVILFNHSIHTYLYKKGERIAQIIFLNTSTLALEEIKVSITSYYIQN